MGSAAKRSRSEKEASKGGGPSKKSKGTPKGGADVAATDAKPQHHWFFPPEGFLNVVSLPFRSQSSIVGDKGGKDAGETEGTMKPPPRKMPVPEPHSTDRKKASVSGKSEKGSPKKSTSKEIAVSSKAAKKDAATQSSSTWKSTIVLWVAAFLFWTNVVTLGLLLQNQMEHEQYLTGMKEIEAKLAASKKEVEFWEDKAVDLEREKTQFRATIDELKEKLSASGGTTECTDKHENCATWASQGECETNASFMHAACRPSCGLC